MPARPAAHPVTGYTAVSADGTVIAAERSGLAVHFTDSGDTAIPQVPDGFLEDTTPLGRARSGVAEPLPEALDRVPDLLLLLLDEGSRLFALTRCSRAKRLLIVLHAEVLLGLTTTELNSL